MLALPQMVSVVRLARVKAVGRHAQGKKERQNGNGCNSSKVVHNKSLKAAHCVRWTASVGAWLRHFMRRLPLPLSSTLCTERVKEKPKDVVSVQW